VLAVLLIVRISCAAAITKVLWDDTVSPDPVSSARQFINVFFVDKDMEAVVAVRLPYNRVNINGTAPFTFASNDVVRGYFSGNLLHISTCYISYGCFEEEPI